METNGSQNPPNAEGSGNNPSPVPNASRSASGTLKVIKDGWGKFRSLLLPVLGWLGIGGFSYATIYARPVWAGVWLLAFCIFAIYEIFVRKPQRQFKMRTKIGIGVLLCIALILVGFSGVREYLQRQALAHFYSLNPKNLDFGTRRHLNAMTADLGTWDQIRKI